jgi:hypothetical protein
MACSHDAQLVLKAPRYDNNLRTDGEEGAKDGVVVPEGDADWDKLDRLVGSGRLQDPTRYLPSEGSCAWI